MTKKEYTLSDRRCFLYQDTDAAHLLIQPIDEHDLEVLDQEVEAIKELTDKTFSLVTFMIKDWNQELTPWAAPPVFGKTPFGNGAEKTLEFITSQLLPEVQVGIPHLILGGYSLAGLFALWAGYQTDRFEGIAAASPSVWYPQWIDYASENKPLAKSIYLSLGDKEEKTKHPVMAQVGNAIRKQHELLTGQGINSILEWNAGNHFIDSDKRTAKGFAWVMDEKNSILVETQRTSSDGSPIEIRHSRPRQIMPYAEDCAGDCGQRIGSKMDGGQTAGQS